VFAVAVPATYLRLGRFIWSCRRATCAAVGWVRRV